MFWSEKQFYHFFQSDPVLLGKMLGKYAVHIQHAPHRTIRLPQWDDDLRMGITVTGDVTGETRTAHGFAAGLGRLCLAGTAVQNGKHTAIRNRRNVPRLPRKRRPCGWNLCPAGIVSSQGLAGILFRQRKG